MAGNQALKDESNIAEFINQADFLTPFSSIADNRKTVTTAGTRETLAASTDCKKVVITAMIANTGYIVIGGSTVVALEATRQGIPLSAGQSMDLNIDDLSKIYLDAETSGEGVTYIYFN